VSLSDVLLWVIFPYVAAAVGLVGLWWRYRVDQFGWTSQSTQLFEHKILGWAGPAFHYGALAAIGGHVIGLFIPESLTSSIGISEDFYRWFAGIAGGIAGAVCIAGFFGLVYRRATNARVRRSTSQTDIVTYALLTFLIGLGCYMTFGHTLFTSSPFNYRTSVAEWWRSLFYLHPDVHAVNNAKFAYQLHAIVSWAFWAIFPFSRLVHMVSIPLQYLGRPYILYRRRYPPATTTRTR
jgi:respiratory nitrate reductase gamma subunit